jgi:hypothetical protein
MRTLLVMRHRKISKLSDSAFRLWFSMIEFAREQSTDGRSTAVEISFLARAPRGKKRQNVLRELTESGLLELLNKDEFELHDFLHWQDDSQSVSAKRAKARARMRRVRANRERTESEPFARTESEHGANVRTDGSDPVRDGEGRRKKEEGREEGCSPSSNSRPKRDPMADQLRSGGGPRSRPDVRRLHERFKLAIGLPGLSLDVNGDFDAQTLADALDAHGPNACDVVADESPHDRMVTGEADERGNEHKSVGYVFGKPHVFARILAAGKKRLADERKVRRGGPSAIERALSADVSEDA